MRTGHNNFGPDQGKLLKRAADGLKVHGQHGSDSVIIIFRGPQQGYFFVPNLSPA